MKPLALCIAAALIAAATAPALATEAESLLGAEYRNSAERFTIRPPVGWKAREAIQPGIPVGFFGSQEGGFLPNVNVYIRRGGYRTTDMHLSEVVGLVKKEMNLLSSEGGLSEFKVIGSQNMPLDGRPAFLVQGTYLVQGVRFRNLQLLTSGLDRNYVVTYTHVTPQYIDRHKAARASLLSFRPLDPALPIWRRLPPGYPALATGLLASGVILAAVILFRRRKGRPPADGASNDEA